MAVFERALKVGKTDNYTFSMSSKYLGAEVVLSSTVTTASTNLTVNSFTNDDTTISVLCTGVTAGDAELHFDWTTATRSGCESHVVIVLEC